MGTRFASTLFGDLDVAVEFDAPVAARTFFVVGGRADALVRPNSEDALAALVRRCSDSQLPLRILGRGANLLIDDIGVDGIVVQLDHEAFRGLSFNREGPITAVRAMAGADMARTLMRTVREGLDGLAAMAGIPATIGGAVRMNAGGTYGCISDHLETITCVTSGGEIVTYPASEIDFEYRCARIADPIVLCATFALAQEDPVAVRARVKEIFAWKASRQPLSDATAGCAFKNPIDPASGERVSAGRLIDEAGLKGVSVGGAHVSRQHANFISTTPDGNARDVLALMDLVRQRVQDACGIILQREVVIWSREEADA